MSKFTLKDSNDHYLQLSEPPVRFEPASSVTNIFFDDTNGQVSVNFISCVLYSTCTINTIVRI